MRKIVLVALILLSGVIFTARLFYLQVYDYPQRGYVFDRNGELLVSNQPSYDVMAIPREIKSLDTLEFINLLGMTRENFETILNRAWRYSPRLPSVVMPQLSKAEYASLSRSEE